MQCVKSKKMKGNSEVPSSKDKKRDYFSAILKTQIRGLVGSLHTDESGKEKDQLMKVLIIFITINW